MPMDTEVRRVLRPEQVLAGGFLVLIAAGTALLCLPFATTDGQGLNVFDSLFTAASAVCVTGLVAVDTGTALSFFGQAVLLLLIQVGGLGFMVFATLVMGLMGRRLTLRDRVLIRESMSGGSLSGLMKLTWVYGAIALIIEGAGALVLCIRMIPRYGLARGLWFSVFHAVSAFCNAGFDLFGGYASLTGFRSDALVLLTIAVLVILGGIGFYVIFDVVNNRFQYRGLSLHTRIVLWCTGILLLAGTVLLALCEWNNPRTLGAAGSTWLSRLLDAFFQSVSMRTAGFGSIDLGGMSSAGKMVCVVLMFIGASPASTGGGVKTTTVALVLLTVWSVVRGSTEIQVMKKRLPQDLVRRALAIVVIAMSMLLLCATVLACAEHDQVPFIDLLFESASAIATVGVSAAGTPGLTMASRAMMIPMMYLGRVGPLTLALAFASRMGAAEKRVRYPEEKIMIG